MSSFIDIPDKVEVEAKTTWLTAIQIGGALAVGLTLALTFYAWVRKKF